jgi:hypothetical protein
MSEYVDKICASVTKQKKGGEQKELRKALGNSAAEVAYTKISKKL